VSGLALRFTRLSATRHRFNYRRDDGTGETIEMESEGLLFHDLLHLALEGEAGLKGSFYGLLDKIGGYEELTVNGGAALGGEVAITERVAGAIADALRDPDLAEDDFAERVVEELSIHGERPPRWLTPALIGAVRARMIGLIALWQATPVDETMSLRFPPSP
jgi:hypothetical protein